MTCVSGPSEGNFIWSDHLRNAALGVGGGVGGGGAGACSPGKF